MKTTPKGIEEWISTESEGELADLHDTDALARRSTPQSVEAISAPPTSNERQEDQSLFRDPTMAPPIDFQSETGFKQAAKKKGGKAAKNAKASPWDEPEEKKEEGEGAGDGGDGGKDNTGGADAGGDGDKKDDEQKDGDKKEDGKEGGDPPPEDEEWGSFAPTKSKKKGKKGKGEEPAPAAPVVTEKDENVSSFDNFDDIKLDTPMIDLDLNFDAPPEEKKSGGILGSWASSWTTGGTTTKASRLVGISLCVILIRIFLAIKYQQSPRANRILCWSRFTPAKFYNIITPKFSI